MNKKIMQAFYCRAKPQTSDAWPIFRDAPGVFIGYPLVRHGLGYDPHALAHCLVNPGCSQEEWDEQINRAGRTNQFSANRNLVRDVATGSIVVIPRPGDGLAHLGRIAGPFEIVNDPPWLDDYLELRRKQRLDDEELKYQHAADVAQGWPVEKWVSVSLSSIPGWIRRSLFGRSTYGRLHAHPLDPNKTAQDVLAALLESGGRAALPEPSVDLEKIKSRLVDTLTAGAFEHLMVNLMQLENPKEFWTHTGGPGDGGVDGLGVGRDGRTVAVMQCKLYGSQAAAWSSSGNSEHGPRRITAILVDDKRSNVPADGTLCDLETIAALVKKHHKHLPEAKAMRIFTP